MRHPWGSELASLWTRQVPPSRPTPGEIARFTRFARTLQAKFSRRLDLTILGSTPEFQDWGFQEYFNVTVVDKSPEYHQAIRREVRHKESSPRLVVNLWEELNLPDSADLVVGDLTFGNVPRDRFQDLLWSVYRTLRPEGLFMGKNVFQPITPLPDLDETLARYRSGPRFHPYSALAYFFAMDVFDSESQTIDFQKLFQRVCSADEQRLLHPGDIDMFRKVGLEVALSEPFFVPSRIDFEELIAKLGFSVIAIEHTDDVFTEYYPLYILEK